MDCQLLCLLAASIGFSSVDDIEWCRYCGDLQVTMDQCIDLGLSASGCRQRYPDQQVYVYCISIAQKYGTGAVNVMKRCIDKDAYKADVLTLDKHMLNTSLECVPNRPSNFQDCQCGDLCQVRTTTATKPTSTSRSTSLSTTSMTTSMTTLILTTTTTQPSTTKPSSTKRTSIKPSSPSTSKIAIARETTPGQTIVVANEANVCSYLCFSSCLIIIVSVLSAPVLRLEL